MQVEYKIHPSIGIARLGNSTDEFYLAPTQIGGKPIECDKHGNELVQKNGSPKYVAKYKDKRGRVKRQAAKFRIFRYDDAHPEGIEVHLGREIKKIEWRVHIANKKAAWREFWEFSGDLMFNDDNSYENRGVPWRNSEEKDRKKLIIDPGPRILTKPKASTEFNKETAPKDYRRRVSFPKAPKKGFQITTLGEMRTDSKGNLIVLGGHGNSGGDLDITGYGGEDTWNDDTSDGPVTCKIQTKDGKTHTLDAWVIVGSPNFAPEIVNITTLDDLMFDVAVRKLGAMPKLYSYEKKKEYEKYDQAYKDYKNGKKKSRPKKPANLWKWGWNPDYEVNYKRDIESIIRRPAGYRWVANVPSMIDFMSPLFDVKDNNKDRKSDIWKDRQRYFRYWREPGYVDAGFRKNDYPDIEHNYGQRTKAFSSDVRGKGIPLMPVNSGSNVITDAFVDKFATLSSTQYQLLRHWSDGKFVTDKKHDTDFVHPLDRASVGNCVGMPMCPGIEVTWTVRNRKIYSAPYRIKHRKKNYQKYGLDPSYDETDFKSRHLAEGCEPGDLTKRMANPWQSDLFQCNVDYVTFHDDSDKYNKKGKEIPDPPTFVAYWWPPSAPWDVMAGIETAREQKMAGWISAGKQVRYTRGISNIVEMVYGWSYMGFIVNQNDVARGSEYAYFVEKERNHKEFGVQNVTWTNGIPNYTDSTYNPEFYLKRKPQM